MTDKQANILNNSSIRAMLRYVAKRHYPLRDLLIIGVAAGGDAMTGIRDNHPQRLRRTASGY